jgi:hypothetical protein
MNEQTVQFYQSTTVPIDVYGFFDIPPYSLEGKDLDTIKEISDWALGESKSLGDAMVKLRSVESRIGHGRLSDNKMGKIYGYIKLDKQINDLIKRQGAI